MRNGVIAFAKMSLSWNVAYLVLLCFYFFSRVLSFNIPLEINQDSIFNVVSSNLTSGFPRFADNIGDKYTRSFTHFQVDKFNLTVATDGSNITLQQGYLKFSDLRLSSNFILFILIPNDFWEAVSSITLSGFGTSENVLFMIQLPSGSRTILESFTGLVSLQDIPPFHAPLAFLDDHFQVEMFCYFCPKTNFHEATVSTKVFDVFKVSLELNNKGYGRHFIVKTPFPSGKIFNLIRECYTIFKDHKSPLEVLMKALQNCMITGYIELSAIQASLNVTINLAGDPDFPLSEKLSERWFLQVMGGESLLSNVPNVIIQTRGFHWSHRQFKQFEFTNYIACIDKPFLSKLEFSIFTALDVRVWGCLIAASIFNAFVFKSLNSGLDIFRPMFGAAFYSSRVTLGGGVVLLQLAILSLSYQSFISSESMAIGKFPSFFDLVSAGYKLTFEKSFHPVLVLAGLSLPANVSLDMEKLYGIKYSDMFVAKFDARKTLGSELKTYLRRQVTEAKMMYSTSVSREYGDTLGTIMGEGLWILGGNNVCKKFDISNEPLPFSVRPVSLRIWGYLSRRMKSAVRMWEEQGFLLKLQNLRGAMESWTVNSQLQVEPLGGVRPPRNVNMWSPIGIAAILLFLNGSVLLMFKVLAANSAKYYKTLTQMWKAFPNVTMVSSRCPRA